MSTPWGALDDRAWRLYAGVHRLLIRLAGRLPDEVVTRARTMLAAGDLAYLPDMLTLAAAENGVSLTAGDLDLLRDVLAALGLDGEPAGAAAVPPQDGTEAPGYAFSPDSVRPPRIPPGLDLSSGVPPESADLEDDLFDLTDHLVVDALSERAGVVTVRRAWRATLDGSGAPHRVYLAEVDPGVAAWELTAEAQTEMDQMDEPDPQVEVYWTGDDLPPYHRAALTAAVLLWHR
ncbi:hypothetical protein ACFMQL_11265 [Nonomuraea fastidiosa]|uniref:hypothetical protein n=1 Tax=Nonomuraea TaxID=83681 RepID=UPI003245583D